MSDIPDPGTRFLEVEEHTITRQDVWCGGQWDAALQAEIEAGLQSAREGS
jgi:hypothetical protein